MCKTLLAGLVEILDESFTETNMKVLLAFTLLFSVTQLSLGQKCENPTVSEDRRVCSHMVVEFSKAKTTSRLVGIVEDPNGDPVPESIIELYDAKENGKLIATFKTDETGRFCIKNLKKGTYFLRAGWSRLGFYCTDMKIEISGRTKRFLRVPLEVGT